MGCCIGASDASSNESGKGGGSTLEACSRYFAKENDIGKDYKKIKVLGDGASCMVLKVKHTSGNCYAMKKMERQREHTEMFIREITILKTLDHPNILTHVDDFYTSQNMYMVTELCSGGELFDRIIKAKSFTEEKAKQYTTIMFETLRFLHSKGVAHRDLKPENFCFKTKADDAPLVLIDFGVATQVDSSAQYAGIVGTPFYLAPEYLIKTNRTGTELFLSDVWSTGVIAYIMLTGCPPFPGKNNAAIFKNIVRGVIKWDPKRSGSLTQECKYFIEHLLKPTRTRPTAEKALKHRWLSPRDEASTETGPILSHAVEGMREFQLHSKLHKAVTPLVNKEMKKQGWELSIEEQLEMDQMFKDVDENGDGFLEEHEITRWLIKTKHLSKEQASQRAKNIMQNGDDNGDGKLSLEEYQHLMKHHILLKQDNILRTIFNTIDLDGDEEVTVSELMKVLDIDAAYAEDLVKEADISHNGIISFEEFKRTILLGYDVEIGDHTRKAEPAEVRAFQQIRRESKDP